MVQRFGAEQRFFIYCSVLKTEPTSLCCGVFLKKFPDVNVSCVLQFIN
jgi:hypothetical protein